MRAAPHQHSIHPLAYLAVALIAGILSSHYIHLPVAYSLVITVLLVLGLLGRGWFSRFGSPTRSAMCVLILQFFVAGANLAWIEQTKRNQDQLVALIEQTPQSLIELVGTIDGPPEFSRSGLYFQVSVISIKRNNIDVPVTGSVSLFSPLDQEHDQDSLRHGSLIRSKALLNRHDKYRNPGGPSLEEFLERKGYDAIGVVKGPITLLQQKRSSTPIDWLYAWRARLQREIDTHFSVETAGILDAALIGNRYNLSRNTAERFREGGTFHVLVISGLHISFIGAIVLLLIRRITNNSLVQFAVPTLMVWSYSIAVGAESSVVRSALMFTFVAFAKILFRSASSLNALGAAALVTLIRDPQQLFDPSWQLTFLSVLAIVVFAWPLISKLSEIGKWRPTAETPYPPVCTRWVKVLSELLFWSEDSFQKHLATSPQRYRLFKASLASVLERLHLQFALRYMFAAGVVSVGVQVVLLPFQIIYFHRLSLAFVVLNIVVGFLLALLAALALLAVAIAPVSSFVGSGLVSIAEAISYLMTRSVDPFTSVGLGSLRLPEYSGKTWWLYVLYFVPLLWLIVRLNAWCPLSRSETQKSKRTVPIFVLAQVLMIGVLLVHPFSEMSTGGRLQVDFLDVGQGDSALVTMPDGTTLLIDGGGRPNFLNSKRNADDGPQFERDSRNIGEAIVSEYLWWRGLDHIDLVLPTHADADHIDGLNDVVKNFRVRGALLARMPANDDEYLKFSQSLKAANVPIEVIQSGDIINCGGVEVRVLWPLASANSDAASMNNESAVVLIRMGKRSILMTGDIEKAAEQYLVGSESLKVDVVKVPHHGSRTSSTPAFVLATSPTLAIISVGRNSMFGHPHPEVVERWRSNGASVLTTGVSGTLTISTNGDDLLVDTFVK